MKFSNLGRRVLSVLLVLAMVVSMSPMAFASPFDRDRKLGLEKVDGFKADLLMETPALEEQEDPTDYADTDVVRVSIVLKDLPTLKQFSTKSISSNPEALAYRNELKSRQAVLTAAIERQALKGEKLDVVWNLTLAANVISANVPYGTIDAISKVVGVSQVVIEERYDPMTTSDVAEPYQSIASGMVGAGNAWASGYTGAGTRIAIIDTGLDTDHQSFNVGAYRYALSQQAESKGMDVDSYIESLDLLDKAEVEAVFQNLNVYPFVQHDLGSKSGAWYVNEKIPFAVNYVDRNYKFTHDYDAQGGHGSHVAGIAAANRFIPNGKGGYDNALEAVYTQGMAPDAQIIVMKVFGNTGGAYESDYMVAIEDAIWLGCDVVNLSLGSNKGFSRSRLYQDILDSLAESDTVVAIAAGNSGHWADHSANGVGHLYAEDVDVSVIGSPSTVTNSFSVASVENNGITDFYIRVGENILFYTPGVLDNAYLPGLETLKAGDYAYVITDGLGTAEEAAAAAKLVADPAKAIFVCQRGEISFADKAANSAAAGFAACIVYNNAEGSFNMNLQGYEGKAPCVSITDIQGRMLKDAAENGIGTMYVSNTVIPGEGDGTVVMSSYSSWGVPGSLQLKPEITAPGGNIYSVDGTDRSGKAYMNSSGTSMAAPQIAGMTAVVMQYIRENGLTEKTGLTERQLATALLMATAEPIIDTTSNNPYPVMQQGSGLANVAAALEAESFIRMDPMSTSGAADGKVKVELGDDPARDGIYAFGFTIHNFSNTVGVYSLKSDFFTQGLFTQDGVSFLDKETVDLNASAAFTVDAEELAVSAAYACDLNGDGLTNEADAAVILDYAAKKLDKISDIADLDANGKVNSYDAHLLLNSIESEYFQVLPGESVHVQVTLTLNDKAYLDEAYVNGAYIEGFVTVQSAPDAEGAQEPDYSIPVLGFYGNWSDASMYDRASYTEYLYDDYVYPYTGGLNYMSVFYDELNEYYFAGNPYMIEDTYPAGREALNTKTELGDMAVTLIRGAGGFLFYVLDGERNFVNTRSADQLFAANYNDAYGAWLNVNNVGLTIWDTPANMGFEEGDKFTIGFMSVPEYYEHGEALTEEELKALMTSGDIGPGAFHEYTFTMDNTAPEVLSAVKDEATGNLTITARDSGYIAALAVLDAKGSAVLTMTIPQQTEAGQTTETVIDMSDIAGLINKDCIIMVADYACNETYYKVTGYNDGWADFVGRMYGFTDAATRGTPDSWMEIRPEDLYYSVNDLNEVSADGTMDVANMPFSVIAAEYVGGHIFMIADNGNMYVADQGDWENFLPVGRQRVYASVRDLAYSTSNGKLYALVNGNTVYSVDLTTGALTKEFTVSLTFPGAVTDVNRNLLAMTIDDEGNFYAVNNGDANFRNVYLFRWNLDDVVDGKVTDLAPINNAEDGYAGEYIYNDDADYLGRTCTQSMAWDHDTDTLYWVAGLSVTSPYNILYTFDTETGKASVATAPIPGIPEYDAGVINSNVSGLYIVPSEDMEIPGTGSATRVELSHSDVELFVDAQFQLAASVYPWNLTDISVTWSSSNEDVVSVDENGLVTAHSTGSAVITAASNANPELSASCAFTVTEVKDVELKALAYNAEGNAQWIAFNLLDPASWTVQNGGEDAGYDFIAGTRLNNTLYYHDGSHMYAVDANTFEVTDCGDVDITWQWSDAAAAPLNSTGYFDRIVGIINEGLEIGVMNINTGMGFDLPHMGQFKKDPMALIAYKGEIIHTDEYGTYPAYQYYVLTEKGELWVATTFGFYDEDAGYDYYDDVIEYVGSTGLNLKGISDVTSGRFGSMYYDIATDQLIVSACLGEGNKLFVFDPDVCAPVELEGTFGEDLWPVTALYTYDTYTSLTVTVDPITAEIYQDDTLQMSAKVYKYQANNSVTWSSSDESIATVDQKGLVTAVAPGTVQIIATSVEGDASAACELTVLPLSSFDAWLHAYRTTEDGGEWIAIDGRDLSVTVLAESDAVYTGAGAADGKVYATDHTYYYQIDPVNGHAVTTGDNFTDADGAACLYMLDGSSSPVTTVTLPDFSTGEEVTVEMGGKSVYLSGYDGDGYHYLTILDNYETGKYSVAPIPYTYNPAAVAYRSSEIIEGYWFDFYMILGYDGLLESYSLYTAIADGEPVTAGGFEVDTVNTGLTFEDGDDVSMTWINTEDFNGAVISHAGDHGVELWLYDWANQKLEKLGTIEGTDLVGLSLLSEVGLEAPEESEPEIPEEKTILMGYVYTGESYMWATIDPEDGSYEKLADGNLAFNGGGFSNGKFYATYAASAYGAKDYYMIDPENGYAAAKGYSGYGVYHIYDGAGAPKQTVSFASGNKQVGGYMAYISWQYSNYYVFLLSDYTNAKGYSQPSLQPKLPAKPLGMAYCGGSMNADATVWTDTFLVLCANGAVVQLRVESTDAGVGGYAYGETVATVSIDGLSTATNVSMTAIGGDKYVISVACVEGVQLYTFDLASQTLETAGLMDASTVVALTDYAEVTGEEPANAATGSLMSVSLHETSDETVDLGFRLDLTETEPTTNGVFEVTYDAEQLSYIGTNAGNVLLSVNAAEEGKLILAYASAEAVDAGEILASVLFQAKGKYVNTKLTVTTTERGDKDGLTEQRTVDVTMEPYGHDYQVTERVEPTCTEQGHVVYTCANCGNSYTEYLDAHCASSKFVDVPLGEWYHEAVDYVVDAGLMNGMSDTIFAPAGTVNRAQMVTILYRLAGSPEIAYAGTFSDVPDGTFYTSAVEWAAANSIVNGYDNGCFGANDSITREQMVTILYRFCAWRGDDVSARNDLSAFVDADTVSAWARDAMQWAVAKGLINGMTADHIGPTGTTNRAQVAVILQRFCEMN